MAQSLALTRRQGFISRPNFQFEIQSPPVGPLSHRPVCSPALRTASSTALARNSDVHGLMELARTSWSCCGERKCRRVDDWRCVGAPSSHGDSTAALRGSICAPMSVFARPALLWVPARAFISLPGLIPDQTSVAWCASLCLAHYTIGWKATVGILESTSRNFYLIKKKVK